MRERAGVEYVSKITRESEESTKSKEEEKERETRMKYSIFP